MIRTCTLLVLSTLLLAPAACEGDGGAAFGPDADADDPGPDTAAPDAAGPDATVPDADAGPVDDQGLELDSDAPEPGVTPRWEPGGQGWTAVPWPNDMHRRADGTPRLNEVLGNPQDVDLWEAYLTYGEEVLHGFGLNGAIFFELDGPVDMDALPAPEEAMDDPLAAVQLVNATPSSPRYGERMPLLFRFYDGSVDDAYLEPNTLSMRPVFGFPLSEGETWCAVLTRGVVDAEGRPLSPAPGFPEALDTEPTLAPLADWLPDGGLVAEDVAAATCFTTDTPTLELRQVRDYLDTQPPVEVTGVSWVGNLNPGAGVSYAEFNGEYVAPNFQAGDKPYQAQGGDIRFDEDGVPIVQLAEPIRFLLMVPHAGFQMPDDGWPVVLYGHGTGGDWETCKGADQGNELLREGMAVLCIDQPLHGARGDYDNVEVLSFNFFNPRSGRTNFRQSAIDVMSLSRSVAAGAFDMEAQATAYSRDVRFDPERVTLFGHSHGGLAGALVLGVDPTLLGGVLSGAGGVLTETIMRRKDPIDFFATVRMAVDVPEDNLDTFHPAMSVIQMMVDATDPVNYAPYWLDPAAGGRAKHVFVTEGMQDHATPYVTTQAMAAAAGIPFISPVTEEGFGQVLRGLPILDTPVGSNVTTPDGKRTAGLRQWPEGSHWVAFDDAEARELWKSFFRGLRFGQPPVIGE
ncbi:MAG: alpha/beta hydrolase family protein [Myxococcota bacterium]